MIALDALGDRGIPVLAEIAYGHFDERLVLPIGVEAEMDADGLALALLEAACV